MAQSAAEMWFGHMGSRIKEERERRGLSQEKLAVQAGTTRVTLAKAEAGERVGLNILADIAQALGLTLWDISPERPASFKPSPRRGRASKKSATPQMVPLLVSQQ